MLTIHRFEAQINQLALTYDKNKPEYPSDTSIGGDRDYDDTSHDSFDDAAVQGALPLIIAGSAELRDIILARIVDRYADLGYWEKWATDVQAIRHGATRPASGPCLPSKTTASAQYSTAS